LDISISKEFVKALLRYLCLEKFKSIVPLTITLFIVNIFSSAKLFVNKININIVAVKKIKIYSLKNTIEYFNNK
jgi:hypothetical protein